MFQFEKQNCNFIMLSHLVNDKSFSLIEGMMECYKNNGNRILSKPTTKAEEAFSWHGTLLDGQSLELSAQITIGKFNTVNFVRRKWHCIQPKC